MAWWWSWALTAWGVTGLWAAGSGKKWGWGFCLVGQAVWLTYSIVTKQWGFIIGVAAYTFVYARNLIRWHKEKSAIIVPVDGRAD